MALNQRWWPRLKSKIQCFNIFDDRNKTEEEDLKNQRLSTRLFVILLSISTITVLLYTGLTSVSRIVVIEQPSLNTYNTLQQRYPDTLVCPCQQSLISYQAFVVSFKPTFNQICSSDFVTVDWLNYLNYRSILDIKYHFYLDFRHSAYSFFNMLTVLCQLVSSTIDDQLIEFYSTSLFTEKLISNATLNAFSNAAKNDFLSLTAKSFAILINSFRAITQGNNILNRLETNWRVNHIEAFGSFFNVMQTRGYNGTERCLCSSSSRCKATTGIYAVSRQNITNLLEYRNYNNLLFTGQLEFEVEGINVGCLVLDAVLQSNLSCLYNSSCLTQLYTYLHDSPYPLTTSNIKGLDAASAPLPTVEELIGKLMVDEWQFTLSFESYFKECNTQSCSYTYSHQFDVIFMITTTVSFLGGIVTILMFTILPVVTFLRNLTIASRSQRLTTTASPSIDSGEFRVFVLYL